MPNNAIKNLLKKLRWKWHRDLSEVIRGLPVRVDTEKAFLELAESQRRLEDTSLRMESLLKSQSFDGHMEWIRQNLCYIAVDLTKSRSGHDFQFLYNPRDIPMTNEMFKRKVYSEDHLFQFIDLAEKHYGYHPEGGTFLDIGGNIGTTSILVKKCFPKLDVTAFEPSSGNRKTFRINMILNNCEDIRLVGCALSNETGSATLSLSRDNMGDHRIVMEDMEGRNSERVKTDTLLNWISSNPADIKYIWIDSQGYEGFILDGGSEFLARSRIPVWMEFWPYQYRNNGSLELVLSVISRLYPCFIDRKSPGNIQPTGDLIKLANSLPGESDTDIFLIKP